VIRFFLNGTATEELNIPADMTLLRYLRQNQSLVATKEGCGSGDCGACSVLLGEQINGSWQYKAINSCITFVAQLHGKSLITVDQLVNAEGEMHPAQSAMVEYHGSQCGFCTPGIIASLAALHENLNGQQLDQQQILDALSGNLCRCTGYKPIIDAAEHMVDYQQDRTSMVQVWQPEAEQSAPEAGLKAGESQSWAPSNEAELADILAKHPDARMVAGATDIALEVTQMQRPINKLVAINQVQELRRIELEDDAILLGAAVTYAEAEELIQQEYPEFAALLHRLGSRQVRNNGTIGGNIANASPIGDTPPVLLALNACIELASQKGSRWLPLQEFFLDYKKTELQAGEYLRRIRIPRLQENQSLKVYKISKRLEDDISAVLAAFVVDLEQDAQGKTQVKSIRSGFGGMAAIPKAAEKTQQALIGQELTLDNFSKAAELLSQDFMPMSDVRASSNYRLQVARNLMKKCALELIQPDTVSRIESIHSVELSAPQTLGFAGGDHA